MSLIKTYVFTTQGKYKTTLQKQQTQNNSFNVEWWVLTTCCFLFRVRYLRLYWVHHKKKHRIVPTNPATHIYIKKINNRLVLTIIDGYKLELQTSETMKLFISTKKLIDK